MSLVAVRIDSLVGESLLTAHLTKRAKQVDDYFMLLDRCSTDRACVTLSQSHILLLLLVFLLEL